jgi:dTDP-glucose 4,6-dehydratase/UDP-glucose 4-epimerase
MTNPFDRYAARLDGKELLILGGTGFFGQALLAALVTTLDTHDLSTRLVLPTRDAVRARARAPHYAHRAVSLVEVDFERQDHLKATLRPDFIVHMATTSAHDTFRKVPQASKFDLLVNATRAVCGQLARNAPERVIFTSSGVVYGPGMPPTGFREQDPVAVDHFDPASSLAMGKIAAEYMLATHCAEHNVPLSLARCFTFVGPGLPTDLHYAIGNFVEDALAGRDIVIRGDGCDLRSYMHVQDAIAWLAHLLFEPDAPQVMNVGSPHAITIAELATRVASRVEARSQVHILGQAPAGDNYRRRAYWPNVELATSRGLSLTIGLDEAIDELAEAVRRSRATE